MNEALFLKNVELFEKHQIFTRTELHSRCEILLENYCKTVSIEALTMIDMVNRQIIPAVSRYVTDMTETALKKRSLCADICCDMECDLIGRISKLQNCLYKKVRQLESELPGTKECADFQSEAEYYRDVVIKTMCEIRECADELEATVGDTYWPFPTYVKLMFGM